MTQSFDVTATGMDVCCTFDIDREHCSFITWSFLACRTVKHEVGLSAVGMVHLFCRTVHLHTDRPYTVDL